MERDKKDNKKGLSMGEMFGAGLGIAALGALAFGAYKIKESNEEELKKANAHKFELNEFSGPTPEIKKPVKEINSLEQWLLDKEAEVIAKQQQQQQWDELQKWQQEQEQLAWQQIQIQQQNQQQA